jgi:hypothetical protein
MEEHEKQSYYKKNLPNLIERLKNSISKIETIIDADIEDAITDDKLFNVLKAKRQASEDVIWTLKRIDELENELNGVEEENKSVSTKKSWTKKIAEEKKA